jgi:predicted glutamine amidotransferase
MCRLLFIPGKIKREDAVNILKNMYGNDEHSDGTGEVYVKDGKFVVNKYAESLKKVLKKGKPFLSHLQNHDGWTCVHIRRQSVGRISATNAHPFVSMNGQVAVCHNGTIKTDLLSMYLQSFPNFESTTDSACAAEVLSRVSVEFFTDVIDWGGVFGVLNLDGSLEIAKISGELALHLLPDKRCLLASELEEEKYKNIELTRGYFKFNPDGTFNKFTPKKFTFNQHSDIEFYEDADVLERRGMGQGRAVAMQSKVWE